MQSNTLCIVLLVASLSFCLAARQRPTKLRTDASLMQFMLDTRAVQAAAPSRTISCFNYYTPLLNEVTAKYETDYEACLATYANGEDAINAASQKERDSLNTLATSSCSAVANCYTLSDAISAFECFQSTSDANTKDFYSISSTAQSELLDLREQLRTLEIEEYKCTNASERAYVAGTSQTYEQLQLCLSGAVPVPTTPEPTTPSTAAPTTPSTAAPTTPPTATPTEVVPTTAGSFNPTVSDVFTSAPVVITTATP